MRYGKTMWLFVTRGNENVKITKERLSAGERSWEKRLRGTVVVSYTKLEDQWRSRMKAERERERKRKRRIVSTLTSRKRGTVQFSAREWSDGTRESSNVSRFLAERFVVRLTNNKQTTFTPPPLLPFLIITALRTTFLEKGIKFETRRVPTNRKEGEREKGRRRK